MKQRALRLLMALVDTFMACIPRRVPDESALRSCKIISHRGEFDNRTVMENTLPAFINARAAGVWGIECDIQFTSDGVPMVCHDATAARVFGQDVALGDLDFAELREQVPQIPSLAELIDEFGGNTHLMLELKVLSPRVLQQQRECLKELLAPLVPERDFHLLALDPELFALVDFLPPATCLPVAETNVKSMSKVSLERGYCGLSGHYLLLTDKLCRRHAAKGQRIGTGFPRSRNCLYRELNRGIEWIFSNDAVYLQRLLYDALDQR